MPINFQLKNHFVGFSNSYTKSGEQVEVIYRELIPPLEFIHFINRVESFQRAIFSEIPDLPSPLFYDFGPILDKPIFRNYSLESVFSKQTLLLFGLTPGGMNSSDLKYEDKSIEN